MMDISIEELEKAYSDAMQGSVEPDLVVYCCPSCGQSYLFTSGGAGDKPCEHVLALLKSQQTH